MARSRPPSVLLLIAFFFSITLVGQDQMTSVIKGKVIDADSRQALPGATIVLLDCDPVVGVSTDLNGEFRLEGVATGRNGIQVRYAGYTTVTMENLLLRSAKELDLTIELEEDIVQLEAVEITGEKRVGEAVNEMNTISTTVISTEEASRFAGTLLDVSRMSQRYAGVSASDDSRNDVIIRGNSPLGVLWRLEGIDIPSPNHFATLGTTGGPISMLNVNILKNSDFLTGAWNAEYGNALAGVFDLQLRTGNKDKNEQMFQMGFNGLEVGAEGPFVKGRRSSYVFNYRYSLLGILSAVGVDFGTGSAIPEYQDLSFKLNFPMGESSSISFWGVGGLSDIRFQPEEDDNLYSDNYEDSWFVSNTFMGGVTYNQFLDDRTLLKVMAAASLVETNGYIDSVDIAGEPVLRLFEYEQDQGRASLHVKLNRKYDARNRVNIGIMADQLQFDLFDRYRDEGVFVIGSEFNGSAPLLRSYVQWKHRFSEKTSMVSGLHHQSFLENGSVSIEPRLSLQHELSTRSLVSAGIGLHSQLQPFVSYYAVDDINDGLQPNLELDFSRAAHVVLGHQYFIDERTRIKTEVYYQHLYDVPIDTLPSQFSMLNEGADFGITDDTGLANQGMGTNYGLELTLERSLNQGFYYLLTTSLFESMYEGSDGVQRNTAFNSNYIVNLLGGKEWVLNEKMTLSFDARVVLSGGRPYVPIDLQASINEGREVRDWSNAFEARYAPYFRSDIRIGIRQNGKRVSQEFAFDLQNLTNRQNIFWIAYDNASQEIETTYQLGMLPIALYRIYF